MGTKKDANCQIDEDAVHVVEGIVRGASWNRSKPHPNRIGIDFQVNLLQDRRPEVDIYLQIKGTGKKTRNGNRQTIISRSGTIHKPLELEHIDYGQLR